MTLFRSSRSRSSRKPPAIAAAATIAALTVLLALVFLPDRSPFAGIERWLADWRALLLGDRIEGFHDKVAIVVFDSDTFGGEPVAAVPRDKHAEVIRTLDAMDPAAIGLDFYFVQSQGEQKDQAFQSAIQRAISPIVLGAVDGRSNDFSQGQLTYQTLFLREAGRRVGYLNLTFDKGNVVRRMSPPNEGSPVTDSFAFALAKAAGVQTTGISSSGLIAWLVGPDPARQPFLTIPAHDLLETGDSDKHLALSEKIKGRLVIVGINLPSQDRHLTALSVRDGNRMPGVMIHAHMLAQILDGRHFREVTGSQLSFLLFAVAIAGFGLSWLFWQRQLNFLSLGILTIALVGLDGASYAEARTVVPLALVICVWLLAVVVGHNLRVILAWERRRRERRRL